MWNRPIFNGAELLTQVVGAVLDSGLQFSTGLHSVSTWILGLMQGDSKENNSSISYTKLFKTNKETCNKRHQHIMNKYIIKVRGKPKVNTRQMFI